MTKSELITHMAIQQSHYSEKQIEEIVNNILEHISMNLIQGMRIEIRKFGSFSLHHRQARTGRNPKTGEKVALGEKHVLRFKPGKELRDRVNG